MRQFPRWYWTEQYKALLTMKRNLDISDIVTQSAGCLFPLGVENNINMESIQQNDCLLYFIRNIILKMFMKTRWLNPAGPRLKKKKISQSISGKRSDSTDGGSIEVDSKDCSRAEEGLLKCEQISTVRIDIKKRIYIKLTEQLYLSHSISSFLQSYVLNTKTFSKQCGQSKFICSHKYYSLVFSFFHPFYTLVLINLVHSMPS